MINAPLKQEYEALHLAVNQAEAEFLAALKKQSGSKRDLEKEISLVFTKRDDQLERALLRIEKEILSQKAAPFSDVTYDVIFDERVLEAFGVKDVKSALANYIKKLDYPGISAALRCATKLTLSH